MWVKYCVYIHFCCWWVSEIASLPIQIHLKAVKGLFTQLTETKSLVKQWTQTVVCTRWQTVTFQVQQVKLVKAGGGVMVLTSPGDNLWWGGCRKDLADPTKTKESLNGIRQALSTCVNVHCGEELPRSEIKTHLQITRNKIIRQVWFGFEWLIKKNWATCDSVLLSECWLWGSGTPVANIPMKKYWC